MISNKKKFLFLHLPKTGGTSINSSLSKYCDKSSGSAYSKHASLGEMKSAIGDKSFDEYFKFTIIRNPWDRVLSLYFWGIQIKPGRGIQSNWKNETFDSWIKNTFIKDNLYNIWPDQIDLMTINGVNPMNFVGRFENLKQDWKEICKSICIDEELKYLYSTKHKPYHEYYDEESIEIVKNYYSKDIKTFGYEFKK